MCPWKSAGSIVNKEKIKETQEKIDLKILNFISYKARSTAEVKKKLDHYLKRKKNLKFSEIEKIKERSLEKLVNLNLLDDDDYAKSYVNEKIKSTKPVSKLQIRKFLLSKGVPYKIIDNNLKLMKKEIEYAKAKKDATRKLARYKKMDKRTMRNKLRVYLSRKGYPWEVVYSVVDNITGVK